MSSIFNPYDELVCDAGRRADFGGRWRTPCDHVFGEGDALHTLGVEDEATTKAIGGPMHFCDEHMRQLIDAGLITEVAIDSDEFTRRMGVHP